MGLTDDYHKRIIREYWRNMFRNSIPFIILLGSILLIWSIV
jgi:hypothetical protein